MADERTGGNLRTVNQEVRDRGIRHLLYLVRLANREARQVAQLLEESVTPDLVAALETRLGRIAERGRDLGPATTARLQTIETRFREIVQDFSREAYGLQRDALIELAKDESTFQAGVLRQSSPVVLELATPTVATLRAVVISEPFDGATLRDWYNGLDDSIRKNLSRELRRGMVEGETIAQISRRVRGVMGTAGRHAEAIARSSVIHTSNVARELLYDANKSVIKGVQWVSTLDTRTCPQCMSLDGEVYNTGEGIRPPAHVACRCTTVPVLKSWEEMGINRKETTASTRASMNGQVAGKITYGDWLRRQPPQIQADALGKTRAKLFREGKVPVDAFTNRSGDTITLESLRKREADAFEAAGVKV